MTTIYLASYTGTQPGWHGIFNRGIRWLTRSRFSHTEVCIGNPLEGRVWCISSSGVDGGVRAKMMQLSADRWEVLPMRLIDTRQWGGDGDRDKVCSLLPTMVYRALGGDVSAIPDLAAPAEVAMALGVKLRIEGGV